MSDDRKDPWEDAEPELLRLATFLRSFHEESDRGAALTAASILDEVLLALLRGFLAPAPQTEALLTGFNAPLGTFSSRALACLSLGLIEEREFREIEAIRKIRNHFGHSWQEADFRDQAVASYLEQLAFEAAEGRNRFNFTIANLLGDLLWRARLAEREQRKPRAWPHKAGFQRQLPPLDSD